MGALFLGLIAVAVVAIVMLTNDVYFPVVVVFWVIGSLAVTVLALATQGRGRQ